MFLLAAIFGGSLVGLLAGVLGGASQVLASFGWCLAGFAAVAAVTRRFGSGFPRVPSCRRQVSTRFARYPRPVTEAVWGFDMGIGLTTFVSGWSWWAMIGVALCSGSPWVGAMLCGSFGALRGLEPVVSSRLGSAARGRLLNAYHRGRGTILPRLSASVLLLLAVAALFAQGPGGVA